MWVLRLRRHEFLIAEIHWNNHQKSKAPERVKRDPHLFELFLAILQIVKDNVVKMTRVQKCLAIQNI